MPENLLAFEQVFVVFGMMSGYWFILNTYHS